MVHLNLQPDNVIMVSRRRNDIKLIDFGRARRVTSYDGEAIDKDGTAEFMGELGAEGFRVWTRGRGIQGLS